MTMIQIDELHIRVPHATDGQGERSARQIAQRLSESLPPISTDQHIPELRLKIDDTPGSGHNDMTGKIVSEIIRQIKLMQ